MFPSIRRDYAEVRSSPRVCGDVSLAAPTAELTTGFSPRMRGCFPYRRNAQALKDVLPAYAGMFPYLSIKRNVTRSSPRVCGDVSMKLTKNRLTRRFSPRMRGCFHVVLMRLSFDYVLPAYAGMFPRHFSRHAI